MDEILTKEEFRQLATVGVLRIDAARDEHAIVAYLTRERGWACPIFTLRKDPTPTDPGWAEIEADWELKRVIR